LREKEIEYKGHVKWFNDNKGWHLSLEMTDEITSFKESREEAFDDLQDASDLMRRMRASGLRRWSDVLNG